MFSWHLGDSGGECRAHGNLGSAYFSKGSYKEALTAHRYQLVLAMKFKDSEAAASALTSLGRYNHRYNKKIDENQTIQFNSHPLQVMYIRQSVIIRMHWQAINSVSNWSSRLAIDCKKLAKLGTLVPFTWLWVTLIWLSNAIQNIYD